MNPTPLTPPERKAFRARAHPLEPVVIIGEAGLTPGVLKEIDRSLTAHELIKIRVAQSDRTLRESLCCEISRETGAAKVQHIGKLLVFYRPRAHDESTVLDVLERASRSGKKAASKQTPRRNPVSGREVSTRLKIKSASRKVAAAHPPRTDRVRKSGQRSTKKPYQTR